jgi:NAD-specific glutamate dehydrogenase
MLGLAKLQAQAALNAGRFGESPYLESIYRSYFPERFREEIPEALGSHRLHAEIASLCVVNRLVDAGGVTLFASLQAELGTSATTVAAAMLVAEDVMRVPEVRVRIEAETPGAGAGSHDVLIELDEGVRMVARFLVKAGIDLLDIERMRRWRSGLDALFDALRDFLAPGEIRRVDERYSQFIETGLSADLAGRVACLPLADRGLNILRILEETAQPALAAARIYTRLGADAGLNWMYERLAFVHSGTFWDRMVLADLRQGLLDLQRDITEHVLAVGSEDANAAVDDFLAAHAVELDRIRVLQQRAAATPTPSALSAVASRLARLRPNGSASPG